MGVLLLGEREVRGEVRLQELGLLDQGDQSLVDGLLVSLALGIDGLLLLMG